MNKKIGKNYIFLRKFCKKLYNLSENMAKIDALFTKSLTFLRFILNLPPPLAPESLKIYTHALLSHKILTEQIHSSLHLSLVFCEESLEAHVSGHVGQNLFQQSSFLQSQNLGRPRLCLLAIGWTQ